MASLLDELLFLLADVIGLPTEYAMGIFAIPALFVGMGVWWSLIERRNAYTYGYGAMFGLVTAFVTGIIWTLRFVNVWGIETLTADVVPYLVGFVLGVATLTGILTGVLLMGARRRFDEPVGSSELRSIQNPDDLRGSISDAFSNCRELSSEDSSTVSATMFIGTFILVNSNISNC